MKEYVISGVKVTMPEGFTADDAAKYVDYVKSKVSKVDWDNAVKIDIEIIPCDDGLVDVDYSLNGEKFERIRRITGYLTGDLTSWNNAKRSEEKERVKHGVEWFTSSGRANIED